VSLYHAMSQPAVAELVAFITDFAARHG